MRITVQLILGLVLVSTSLISLAFVLAESANYDVYYWQGRSAVLDPTSNNTRVISLKATRDAASGYVLIQASVSATNPSGYQGFTLRGFDLKLSFFRPGNISEALFWTPNQLLPSTVVDKPLGPGMTITTTLPLLLNSAQSSSYQMFNQTYGGNVEGRCVLTTNVNSFLDPVYGVMTTVIQHDLPVS